MGKDGMLERPSNIGIPTLEHGNEMWRRMAACIQNTTIEDFIVFMLFLTLKMYFEHFLTSEFKSQNALFTGNLKIKFLAKGMSKSPQLYYTLEV